MTRDVTGTAEQMLKPSLQIPKTTGLPAGGIFAIGMPLLLFVTRRHWQSNAARIGPLKPVSVATTSPSLTLSPDSESLARHGTRMLQITRL